jgi:hypothetical protein
MRTRLAALAVSAVVAAAILTACGPQAQTAPPTATPGVQTVRVTLTDTTITASQTTFRPGVRCHFVVTNSGTVPHQFWLMPQGTAQMMGRMPTEQWRQQLLYASQDIGPGRMAAFDYTFTMPMMQQSLALGCYAAGHPLMQLPITVRP